MVKTENGIIKPAPPPQKLDTIAADQLITMEIEPTRFVVEKLLPYGFNILASPPKFGKSWLSLDLCVAVASGGRFLGFQCNKSDALYLALEDSNSRLQDRLRKMLGSRPAPPGFFTAICANNLDEGLLKQLEDFLESHPNTRLIVIDTFAKIRGEQRRNESVYKYDYRETGDLKQFADKHKICVLIVHHLRKLRDTSDPFSNISGSNGVTAAADTLFTLGREKRMDENTKLSVVGRDVEMNEYSLIFDKTSFRWRMLGTSEDVERETAEQEFKSSPIVQTILALIERNNGTWQGTTAELMNAGRFIIKRPLAANETQLGKKLVKLHPDLMEYAAVAHETVKGKSGNTIHRFSSTIPFI